MINFSKKSISAIIFAVIAIVFLFLVLEKRFLMRKL